MNTLLLILSLFILSCNSSQNNIQPELHNNSNDSISLSNVVQADTIKRPFLIILKDVTEIRMGSPYNSCAIELSGADKITLPKATWQDKYAWNDSSTKLVLVKWEGFSDGPVFRLFIIDTETGKTQESIRMFGAINNLQIKGNTITYSKFYYNRAMSKDTLCCKVQEDYLIKD